MLRPRPRRALGLYVLDAAIRWPALRAYANDGGLDAGGFGFGKSFRTNDLAELSKATPPITTSFFPSTDVVLVVEV